MKQFNNWVAWGIKGKSLKCPYNPAGSKAIPAKADDPKTWGSYEQAVKRVETGRAQGIGFELGDSPYMGIDLDTVRNPETGEVADYAQEIIDTLSSYTEISPSGYGFHIIVKADITLDRNKAKLPPNDIARFDENGKQKSPEIEIYTTKRYFTMTGECVGAKEISVDSAGTQAVYDKYLKPATQITAPPVMVMRESAKTPNDWLQLGLAKDKKLYSLYNGARPNGNESSDDLALISKLAYWLNGDEDTILEAFLESPYYTGKSAKHEKKCEREDYLPRTIETALIGLSSTAEQDNAQFEDKQSHKKEAVAWKPPIPFNVVKMPPFPVDALPNTLKDYVLAVAEATQTPVDMAGVAALAVIALCVQRKYKVRAKSDWEEPLNLYSVLVAKPAERKSAIMNFLTKYIAQYEYEKSQALDGNTKFLRLLADDTSPEALTSLLANNNGKMAVISSEGGIFEILQGRYSQNVNIDTFLKAHCGDQIRIDRKGRDSEIVQNPCLTVLLSIQPQVLSGLMTNKAFRGRGLTARFLFSVPQSTVGNRKYDTEPIPEETMNQFKGLCYSLLDIPQPEVEDILTLSPEATELSKQFANELEPRLVGDLEYIADWAGKLHGAIIRIAGILHLANSTIDTKVISAETLRNAIDIGRYFLEHAKMAFLLMDADDSASKAQYVLKRIEDSRQAEISKRDLHRACHGRYKKVDDMDCALKTLIEMNYIRVEKISTGGRPSDVVKVNPAILGDKIQEIA